MLFHLACMSNYWRHSATEVKFVIHQDTTVLNVLPAPRSIHSLQGADTQERTWFRKLTMPTWELEEQLDCWLWKDDCSAGELGQKEWDLEPAGQPASGEISLHWYLLVTRRWKYKMEGQEVICRPYVISISVKMCVLEDSFTHTALHHAGIPLQP